MNMSTEVAKPWHEQDGIIYFAVTSDGTTGEAWIARLISKDFHVSDYAKSVLRSKDFKPTTGVTCEIAVLNGSLFSDSKRITKNIRKKASEMKLAIPNAEISCLIREMFMDYDLAVMGLMCIVTMHNPIKDSDCDPLLLTVNRGLDGRQLSAYEGRPGCAWGRGNGYAFVSSQVS